MKALLVILALAGLVAGQDLKPLVDICTNPPKTPPKTLSDKMSLQGPYKIFGSLTDWMKASTSLLTETRLDDKRILKKQTVDQKPQTWVHDFGDGTTTQVNETSGECNATASPPKLLENPRFASVIGSDTSSIESIIQGLIEFDKTHTGFLMEDHTEVVGGVNSMRWVSCIDGAKPNDSKVLLEVRYAGENTLRPAHPAFSNPLLLSIRLVELPNFNTTVATNHMSIEVDRYELPAGDETNIVHGIFCDGRNSSSLTLKSLDEYAAILNYFDHDTNRSEVVEVLYSKSRQVFIVAGDSFENGVKILGPRKFYNGTDYILHDFKYGYEFTMSREACESFSPLTDSTGDVVFSNSTSSTLLMKPMEWILVNDGLRWDPYQKDVDMFGQPYTTYRAINVPEQTIVELHLTADREVHSMATFRKGSRNLAVSLTVSRIPMESSRLNLKAAQLSDCYDDGKYANNTFIVQVKDKTLSDLSKVGLNRLNEAVVDSISKNVYPVIPYRVVVFYVENRDKGLSMIVRMAEKTETKPAPVVGYNYTAELPTFDLFRMMNDSMFAEKMPIVVEKIGGVKEEWNTDPKTIKMYPPENDDGFLGYTGGAMFVLAIFCLLIGVSIGAVGVFVVTRRQRISTLAYQVFE